MQDTWYRRAQLALNKGEEELAREALRQRKTFTTAETALQKQLDQHTRATQQLLGNIRCGGLVCTEKSTSICTFWRAYQRLSNPRQASAHSNGCAGLVADWRLLVLTTRL